MFRSPLFAWSPQPAQNPDPFSTPSSQSSSRFGAFRHNIRTAVAGSSIYSQSPALPQHTAQKSPFLGFLRREQTSNNVPQNAPVTSSPGHAYHTAGSYIDTIIPSQGPREPDVSYTRHPADVPLPDQGHGLANTEREQTEDRGNSHRHRRKHKKRKQRRADHWVRRRHQTSRSGPTLLTRHSLPRAKLFACIISGVFLLATLATYLAIALTSRDLGQEIHILFILVLLSMTIFFCHSLIRLCMLILHPRRENTGPQMRAMMGSEGFQPIVPIRVHLARDEEHRATGENDLERQDIDAEKDEIPPPPPAYGLWRSSVRVDPNLLHWQRAGEPDQDGAGSNHMRQASFTDPSAEPALATTHRPPSYVSEDGVSYIVEAAPRSTVRQSHTGVSDIHPAWRPGYAMSEIRGDEFARARH